MTKDSKPVGSWNKMIFWIVAGLILLLIMVVMGPTGGSGVRAGPHNWTMQAARAIGTGMYEYAQAHNGAYPTGKSSTEIFQKLLNEGDLNDPSVFCEEWMKVPGKTKATSHTLKPENVCWDVTVPSDAHSDVSLPLIILTGYRVDYVSGGSAVPLLSPPEGRAPGIAVYYQGGSAAYLVNDGQPDGVVINFIPQAFKPEDKKYQQLTPNGPLAP